MKKALLVLLYLLLLAACERKDEAQKPRGWIKKNDFPGGKRGDADAIVFSIGDKGYVGVSINYPDSTFRDMWEYSPQSDIWVPKQNFPGQNPVHSFSIGDKGYVLTYGSTFYEYDPKLDNWTIKQNFPGGLRPNITGFTLGNKAYLGTGTGINHTLYKDFWEYDQTTDTWTQRADVPGKGRTLAIGFSIGGKGYIGLGYDSLATPFRARTDLWEYNSITDAWSEKKEFSGPSNTPRFTFTTLTKAYAVCAPDTPPYAAGLVWEFDVRENQWRQIQDFPHKHFVSCLSFTIGNTAYVVGGQGDGFSREVWEFNP